MRTSLPILLAALLLATMWFGLGTLASAQPPLSDTFLLGAIWVGNDDPEENHYAQYKSELHLNCVFDALKTSTISAAADAGIYIMGVADPGDSGSALIYYNGITGLGKWSTAGRYWAAYDSTHNLYDTKVWHQSFIGTDVIVNDVPEFDPNPVYVRRVEGDPEDADTLLTRLHGGFLPFFWAKENTIMEEDLHHYYVRIYGRLRAPVGEDTAVLTINANWMDEDGDYNNAYWRGDPACMSDTFLASELYTTENNGWKLTEPKELYVQNPDTADHWYWRGSLGIYWTGQRNLEIYYVTISDSIGDLMVYGTHPYDNAITSAATIYSDTTLFRHYIVDEPFWGQVWANAYIDNIIGGNTVPTTSSIITRDPPEEEDDDPWLYKLATDKFIHMNEFLTDNFCIVGNLYDSIAIPNPYESGVQYADYDDALNDQSEDCIAGLNSLVHQLTGPVWEARSRFATHKNFWFQTPVGGWLQKSGNDWRWHFRPTTPEEFRCITWIAVACGARGIIPYRFSSDSAAVGNDMQTGVVDEDYHHDTDKAILAGTGIQDSVWVFWKSNYDEMASCFQKLEAMGPKLMQMEYDTTEDFGVTVSGLEDNHYFVGYFNHDNMAPADPDGSQAHYFALVNRNCWPFDDYGDTLYFDISSDLSGTLYLEDLATHEFFKSNSGGEFSDVPFAAGQGRVFRLAQTAEYSYIRD